MQRNVFLNICSGLEGTNNTDYLLFCTVPFLKLLSTLVFRTGCEILLLPKKIFNLVYSSVSSVNMILLNNFTLETPHNLPLETKKSRFISSHDVHINILLFGFVGISDLFTRKGAITVSCCDPWESQPSWWEFLKTSGSHLFQRGMLKGLWWFTETHWPPWDWTSETFSCSQKIRSHDNWIYPLLYSRRYCCLVVGIVKVRGLWTVDSHQQMKQRNAPYLWTTPHISEMLNHKLQWTENRSQWTKPTRFSEIFILDHFFEIERLKTQSFIRIYTMPPSVTLINLIESKDHTIFLQKSVAWHVLMKRFSVTENQEEKLRNQDLFIIPTFSLLYVTVHIGMCLWASKRHIILTNTVYIL